MILRALALLAVLLGSATAAAQPADDPPETTDDPASPDDDGDGDEASPEPPVLEEPDPDGGDQPPAGDGAPPADGAGEAGDEAGDEAGEAGKPAVLTSEPPPELWKTFDVEGDLLDSKETVIGFLRPRMEANTTLSAKSEAELRTFLAMLGYELLELRKERQAGGAIHAVFVLRPLVRIYQVDVDIDNLPDDWWNLPRTFRAFFESVFDEQIRRRMKLRQGANLPRNKKHREEELAGEQSRILDFLHDQGFFDATARVRAKPRGRNSATIKVDIDNGERYQVGRVQVVGADSIPADEIASKFRHSWVCFLICFLDGGFSREQLNKDVQAVVRMYQQRGFPGVRVRTDYDPRYSFRRDSKTVELTVFVNERRKIDIVFLGNDKKRSPDDKLKKQLTFAEEGSYDDLEVKASADAIRRFYQAKGHFEASVTWKRVPFQVFDRIIFNIDEGPRLPIRNVSFIGNQAIGSGTLRSLVKTREFRDVALLGGGGGFATTVQLRQDVARIVETYRARGFAQVRVRARVARDPKVMENAAALAAAVAGQLEADGLYVRFIIDEGPRREVSGVTLVFPERLKELANATDDAKRAEIESYYAARERRLRKLLGLRAGDPYHPSKVRSDLSSLSRFYFQRGHPHAEIDCSSQEQRPDGPVEQFGCSEVPPEMTSIPIIWIVRENPPVKFGKVAIRGNFHTANWVIRDELDIEEGETMTLARAERAQQNLRTSGLFNAVNVTYVDFEDTDQDTLNVLVNVQERQRYQLEIGGGISTDSGPFAETAFSHRNWLGIGLKPEVRAHAGTQLKFGEAKLSLPRWIGRRASFGQVAFTTEAAVFARRETTERFGDLDSLGTSLALSKSGQYGFFRGWIFQLRYDLRLRFREVDLVRPAGASDDLQKGPVPTITGSVGPQLVIDRRTDSAGRPNPLLPEKGWMVEGHFSFADPVLSAPVELVGQGRGRERFVKVGGSAQLFWKPSKRTLLSNGVRYDHGIPLGNEFLLPEVERFFAGGDTTVRGYEEDRLATELIEEPLPPIGSVTQLRILPAGGNIRFIHNLDLQLEVWQLLGFPVTSALFLDTGLVSNSLDKFEVTDLRHAVGVALFRWTLPVGSLSLEYAVPLDPKTGDDPRGRFHFNLGLLF